MEKDFIGSDCPECLKYKTRECDGKKKVCNDFSTMDFRVPMLYVLLDTCPDELTKLLTNFEMEVIETNQYPYFMLAM